MQTLKVELQGEKRSYPIYIGSGLLEELGELYKRHRLSRRAALISDENVAELYAQKVKRALNAGGVQTELFVLPPGEEHKDLSTVSRLYDKLIAGRFDRRTTIIALGGGVVGDIAGFAAATYLRGLPWVQIPTTLLAQVDASVGGKTGVNHPSGKNLIGAFHQPRLVLIDPKTLETLQQREFYAGLGEVVKYALIQDEGLFDILTKRLNRLLSKHQRLLEEVISICCGIKAHIVAQDEREAGLRRVLNFGHTIGHALEAATNYCVLLHGEAVIWGMVAETWLSCRKGLLPEGERRLIEGLLFKLPLKLLPKLEPQAVLNRVYHDKKVLEGRIHFTLLTGLGKPLIKGDVTEAEILEAISYILN
jgi:3-dehydroquinate synthase